MTKKPAQILVIEDDAAMRSLICEFLELQGHRVAGFAMASKAIVEIELHFRAIEREGQAAMDQIVNRLDLIISDLHMPEMSGVELVGKLRAVAPKLPVILISAYGTHQTQLQALKAGAVAFLNKPFKLSDLVERVGQALNRAG